MHRDRRTAAITGAGSGIGREISLQLARQQWNLHLGDLNPETLNQTAEECAKSTRSVSTRALDVSDPRAVLNWAAAVSNERSSADSVFNVAGVLFSGDVSDTLLEDYDRVLSVNFGGAVNITKAFLPQVLSSKNGRIVNISSAFGLIAAPSYSAYNASKFAVRGFTESLGQELRMSGSTARATCVIPGGVKTSIARTARAAPSADQTAAADLFDRYVARTDPADAARKIIAGAEKGKARVLIGPDARLVDLTVRALGSNYQRILPALQSLRR